MNIINRSDTLIEDMLKGIQWAYPSLKRIGNTHGFCKRNMNIEQVPLISGGGSGHEPSDWGFIGRGMLSGVIMGNIFTPPTAAEIIDFVSQAAPKKRAFFIVKNFEADVASFQDAKKKLELMGWQIGMCVVADDVSVENISLKKRRRGVAGTVFFHKILGYYAENGASIAQLQKVADSLLPEIKTIGVAFSGSHLPWTKKRTFSLKDGEIYYGTGIHGEPGYRKEPFKSSELLARELINKLKLNFSWAPYDKYALLINSLGGITIMESMIFNNDIRQLLKLNKLRVVYNKNGSFMTSSGMNGISLTLFHIECEKWEKALKTPVKTPSWFN
ncbi:MAG: DhaKLM operon coactivator DhaQ [Liquorilactobacillus ghanensis]|uniref:DhaKLM operon coactivator DhaQ n=1 Tax=Liquorilactobacillus ghanensis TaxID=399370 RepID=UPI0039E894AF